MNDVISKSDLLNLLINRIPEARQEFMVLPNETSVYTILHKLCEVTSLLAHQNKFRALKRCLLAAEELLKDGDKQVSNAVCSVYIYRLAMLMDKRDTRADIIHYLLPRALRTEYHRQLNTCLP
ncbi:hypothetical protein G8759_06805 [Spirosoma aureum]|uniref:DUF7674 domain-containing protein n=1 Tax=Spirosoma aureum TaxID=2692134 RepID=A0A6G9AJ63_9BACT|nr:hypothetical protein [Spirosoma aureum]QIP12356.1 hypothetical protein G8759_06805 [Spirosoma aureum]